MKIQTTLFGIASYSIENGADFEAQEIKLKGVNEKCYIDIFEGLDTSKLKKAIILLDNLEELDSIARKELLKAYDDDNGIVCDFINEHFNDYGDEISQEIFKKLNIDKQNDKKFLDNIELGAICAYEEATRGICITLDYNLLWEDIGSPFTDQILAVSFNADMQFLGIAHES